MAVEEKVVQEKHSIVEMIDILAKNAAKALAEFRCYNQEMVDEIVKQMAYTALDHHKDLAKLAVEETRRGVYEDKVFKNMFAGA
jgi:acetaldehyde dehydrogenase / alcohol dehydrogenase